MGSNNLMVANQVTVQSNAGTAIVGESPNRKFLEIKNTSSTIDIYVGGSASVTSSNGHLVRAGESFGWEEYTGPVYARAASSTAVATYVEW